MVVIKATGIIALCTQDKLQTTETLEHLFVRNTILINSYTRNYR